MKLQYILSFLLFIAIGTTAYSQEPEEKKEPITYTYNPAAGNPEIYFPDEYDYETEPVEEESGITIKPAIVGGEIPIGTGPKHGKGPQTPLIYYVGSKTAAFTYTHQQNMLLAPNGYAGLSSNDVHYHFTITSPMDIIVSQVGSTAYPSNIYLVRVADYSLIARNVYSTMGGTYTPTLTKRELPAGTYYVISEAAGNNGYIKTVISATPAKATPYIIDLGTFTSAFAVERSANTTNMPNAFEGQSTNDVFYKFRITMPMEMEFSHCGSDVDDTVMHLLYDDFSVMNSVDDHHESLACANRRQSYMYASRMEVGTYYIVSEGYDKNGVIKTKIWGTPDHTIIKVGTKSSDFYYTDRMNTEHAENSYQGRPTNDVFYELTLSTTMDLVISHCGSDISDTYVTLLDASWNRIAYNDDYTGIEACEKTTQAYLKKEKLPPGTYYIVSEGYSTNGHIRTTIEGYKPAITTAIKSKTSTESYVQTLRPLVATTDATKLDLGECMQTVQYFDGFARPTQTIQVGILDNGYNLVSQIEYDEFGRESRQWIPFRSTSSTAARHTSVESSSTSFHGDTHPYTEIVYDNPALSRVVKTTGPGAKWHSAGKAVKKEYTFNTASGTLSADCYTVNSNGTLSKNSTYKAGELFVEKVTDEDGNISYTFTDKFDQVILQRQMKGIESFSTYYVYDELGRKRYVLPPMMNGSITTDNLNKYAYSYKYDDRGNCIEKKLPGADPIYYVYDKANRLIFSQDGNQRKQASDLFTITKYDKLGRIIYTAEGRFKEHTVLVDYWKDHVMSESFSTQPHTYPMGDTGYSKGYHHLVDVRLLSVYYYDTYDFLNLSVASAYKSALTYSTKSGYGTKHGVATGMLTGMRVYDSQKDNSYTATAYYYDYKGDEIQVLCTTHLQGGYEKNYYKRGFTGNVEFHLKENTATGKDKVTELYEYRYDQGLRVKNVLHKLNNQEKVMLTQNKYNGLGIISSKAVNNNAHTTSYTYNLRNWVTAINGTHFKQNLSYDTYNGNITAYTWKVSTEGFTRQYQFTYDKLNRLTQAIYGEKGTTTTVTNNNYTVSIDQYDKNGNIQKLKRYGAYLPFDGNLATTVATPPTHKYIDIIDNLTMTHNGNQLTKVVEAAAKDPVYNEAMHFKSGSTAATQYTYDNNGNMITDLNKKITKISYNNLNQPTQVDLNQDKKYRIKYSYDASGRKYKTEYLSHSLYTTIPWTPGTGGGIIAASASAGLPGIALPPPVGIQDLYKTESTIEYCGNLIYRDGKLDKVLTPEGYVNQAGNGRFRYHYYLRDHQGNNRVVIDESSKVEQVNHYYPFGALFGDSKGGTGQPYKYNGKELDRMYGLDWYDYHARGMDGITGRFISMDPLAEKYYWISPYVYCMNNPVRFIDPDGKDGYEFNIDTGRIEWLNPSGGNEIQNIDFVNEEGKFLGYAAIGYDRFPYVYQLKSGAILVSNFNAYWDPITYNRHSQYDYNVDDFIMRGKLIRNLGPLGKFILQQERKGIGEAITKSSAERAYPGGRTTVSLLTLWRALALGTQFTGGTSAPRGPRVFGGTQKILKPNVKDAGKQGTGTNPWNNFLKDNKGKYSGKGWQQQAAEDYHSFRLRHNIIKHDGRYIRNTFD